MSDGGQPAAQVAANKTARAQADAGKAARHLIGKDQPVRAAQALFGVIETPAFVDDLVHALPQLLLINLAEAARMNRQLLSREIKQGCEQVNPFLGSERRDLRQACHRSSRLVHASRPSYSTWRRPHIDRKLWT